MSHDLRVPRLVFITAAFELPKDEGHEVGVIIFPDGRIFHVRHESSKPTSWKPLRRTDTCI